MEVIKHSKKYIDLHRIYNIVCCQCGCAFKVERYEISTKDIRHIPITSDSARLYKKYGIHGLVRCPECMISIACAVMPTRDEEEYLDSIIMEDEVSDET